MPRSDPLIPDLTTAGRPFKAILVEDHVMFRDLFRKLCTEEFGWQVIGEASSGSRAKQLIAANRADLVVLDLHLPDGDGFEVGADAQLRWPDVKILVISSHCDDYTLFCLESLPVQGFVDKNSQSLAILRAACAAVQRGETYFSPSYLEASRARLKNHQAFHKILSPRECMILSLIGGFSTDEEISQRLSISPRTAGITSCASSRSAAPPSWSNLPSATASPASRPPGTASPSCPEFPHAIASASHRAPR